MIAYDHPCRLNRWQTQMALMIQEAAEGTSCFLELLPNPQAACCFAPPQSQTAWPKLDAIGKDVVFSGINTEPWDLFNCHLFPCKCCRCLNSCILTAWIWHIHLNYGERHRHREFDYLPTRQDCCCDTKAALHSPASFTYCPCHMPLINICFSNSFSQTYMYF